MERIDKGGGAAALGMRARGGGRGEGALWGRRGAREEDGGVEEEEERFCFDVERGGGGRGDERVEGRDVDGGGERGGYVEIEWVSSSGKVEGGEERRGRRVGVELLLK